MKYIIKIITIVLINFFSLNGKAQSDVTFIEQTAFEYYKKEILPKYFMKKRLKISETLSSINYLDARCLKNKVQNEKNLISVPSLKYRQGYRFILKNDKKLFKKVKNINKFSNAESYVEVSKAYMYDNRLFVVINEFFEAYGKTYTFEFDEKGNMIDWCLSSETLRIITY